MADETEKTLKNILEKSSLLFSDLISEIDKKLRNLRCYGGHRRFLIARLGSTGSTWLAKLLNSHPEVYCEHEGVLQKVYPKINYGSDDIIQFIQTIAYDTHHNAYRATGDVGSIWLTHVNILPKDLFATGLLIRHPARYLCTKIYIAKKETTVFKFTEIESKYNELLKEIWGIDLSLLDDIDRLFVRNSFLWVAQLALNSKSNVLIKIEQMRDTNYAKEILYSLTGVEYDDYLIENMTTKKENVRSNQPSSLKSLMEKFTPKQREWYNIIVSDVAEYIGYTV